MKIKVEMNSKAQTPRPLKPDQRSSKTSQTDPTRADAEELNQQIWRGFGKFIDRITPWLYEVGVLIFGSLIALNLLVQAALFTIGPVDPAVMVATAAFALALPLNVTGLLLLRLIQEMKGARFEDELARALQEAGFVSDQIPAPSAFEDMRKKRTGIVLRLSSGIFALSIALTLIGMMATLWHMAWWIAAGFCIMVMISLLTAILAIASSLPPESQEEKGQKRSNRKEMTGASLG
jgi:hypothetical protein